MESIEYEVMLQCTDKLVISLKRDTDICHRLLRKGLISENTHESATASRSVFNPSEKAQEVVKELRDKVQLNKENYHLLMGELRGRKYYNDIVQILDREYAKLKGEADSSNGSGANIAAPNDGPDEMNGDTCGRNNAVFKNFFEDLVGVLQFSIDSLAGHCWSKELISEQTYSEVVDLNITNADKTRKVLMNVKSNISLQPDALDKFCDILDHIGGHDELVERLKNR